jgi:hypothetical protein
MVPMCMTMAAVTMSNSVTMSVPVAMSMVVITRPMPVTAPAARRQTGHDREEAWRRRHAS